MNNTQVQDRKEQKQSQFDNESVNAIRQGKLVQVRWSELTEDERRAAHVALFHSVGGW